MAHFLSPEAESDLENIWEYIASQAESPEVADRVASAIVDRFLLLAEYPHIGRSRDQELGPGLRTFPVGEYIIIYRILREDVAILRVIHGSRDIRSLLGD